MPTLIARKMANGLVEDVQVDLSGLQMTVPNAGAIEGVIEQFRSGMGGLWVGGTAEITDETFEFHANAMNRSVQTGGLDIVVPLARITDVAVVFGFVTRIIEVSVPGSLVKVRCYGAQAFADRLETAIAAAK